MDTALGLSNHMELIASAVAILADQPWELGVNKARFPHRKHAFLIFRLLHLPS